MPRKIPRTPPAPKTDMGFVNLAQLNIDKLKAQGVDTTKMQAAVDAARASVEKKEKKEK